MTNIRILHNTKHQKKAEFHIARVGGTYIYHCTLKQEHKVFANRLEAGYVYTSTGDMYPLEWCDFELYEHGENGTPPTDHSFRFKAGKGTTNFKILKHTTELQIILLLE